METVFLWCAVIGGTLVVCQFLLSVLGIGHDVDHDGGGGDHHIGTDHDSDHGHEHGSWFFGVLTFRALVTALLFFGLGGLLGASSSDEPLAPLGIAIAAGLAALFGVAWMMKLFHQLKADGTVRIDRTVGMIGTVYLSVPGKNSGTGKVTVKLQNRTVEYQAITNHEALATGTPVQVVAVAGPGTVEVVPVSQAERISHV